MPEIKNQSEREASSDRTDSLLNPSVSPTENTRLMKLFHDKLQQPLNKVLELTEHAQMAIWNTEFESNF